MNKNQKTSVMFGSHMVLQRDKPVPVWGKSRPGDRITVSVQGQEQSGYADGSGKWMIRLKPLDMSWGETLKVSGEDFEEIFDDVLIGDVWIAAGQSNMEFPMLYEKNYSTEQLCCENNSIRFFDYPETCYEGQLDLYDYHNDGIWHKCGGDNLGYFSAVAYYFAKKLNRILDVPVGIIGCNWGGTTASCWMAPEYLESGRGKVWLEDFRRKCAGLDLKQYEADTKKNPALIRTDWINAPETKNLLDHVIDYNELKGIYEGFLKMGGEAAAPSGPKSFDRPGGLFETMVRQVAPMAMTGVIWYQGESDNIHADVYADVFPSLIQCWRDLWKERFPFLFVQLAPLEDPGFFGGEGFPKIREAQRKTADTVENTGMAVITDSGLPYDIHPKDKRPAGERLALLALNKVYGMEDILCEAPTLNRGYFADGALILEFENAGDGLKLQGERVGGLEIFRDGTPVEQYCVTVEKNVLRVVGPDIVPGAAFLVEMACTPYYCVNLYNSAGIPARPARVEI